MAEPCPIRDLIAHEANFAAQMDEAADREGRITDGTIWRRMAKLHARYRELAEKERLLDEIMMSGTLPRERGIAIVERYHALRKTGSNAVEAQPS